MDPITEHELTTPISQPKSPDSGHRRLPDTAPALPPEPEQLPCPRCASTDTKFCYYNNYNLSQPRHFCKSCRRYWTRGGALRKVPVGGGTRKPASSSSSKRRRIAPPAAAAAAPTGSTNNNNNNVVSCSSENETTAQSRYTDPVVSNPDPGLGSGYLNGVAVNLNEDAVGEPAGSLLNCWWSSTEQMGLGLGLDRGLLPFDDGYGLGIGSGMGCGSDVLDWPVEQVVMSGGGDGTDAAVVSGELARTWQMGGGGVAEVGDYFCWPDLAISTPAAKGLK